MPRFMDLDQELELLEKAYAENPQKVRQYIVKVPAWAALRLIKECKEEHTIIGYKLWDLIENYLDQKDRGLTNGLPRMASMVLQALCKRTGHSEAEVLAELLLSAGVDRINELKALEDSLKDSTDKQPT